MLERVVGGDEEKNSQLGVDADDYGHVFGGMERFYQKTNGNPIKPFERCENKVTFLG